MKLHLLKIPEDHGELAAWLEDRLLADDLSELAAELFALSETKPESDSVSLDEALGEQIVAVLTSGLQALSARQIGRLLRHPQLLFELQERVLSEGATYWDAKARSPRLLESVKWGQQRLDAWLAAQEQPEEPAQLAVANGALNQQRSTSPQSRRANGGWRQTAVMSLASAACALVGVFLLETVRGTSGNRELVESTSSPTTAPSWGWLNDAALDGDRAAPAHLRRLASGAQEWFNKRPTEAVAIADRIAQFRQGCSRLQLAPHNSLSDVDRAWVRERCRVWAEKIDEHLAALETGANPQDVLMQMDDTVKRLIAALETRAAQLEQS